MFFDYLGVRLNGEKAAGKTTVLNWQFTDTKQNYVLNLENSALTFVAGAQSANADATLTLTRATLDEISLQKTTFPAALQSGPDRGDRQAREGRRVARHARHLPGHLPVDRTAPRALMSAFCKEQP